MKVIVINSSPKKESSNTHFLLTPFIKGMEKENANIDYYFLSEMNIKSCRGCLNICGAKINPECIIDDDLSLLLPKLNSADIWILGTPIYLDGIYSTLKIFIQRMGVFSKPKEAIVINGRYRHPLKDNINRGKLVFVANSGVPEIENINPAIAEIKAFCKHIPKNEFICAIVRPDSRFCNKNINNEKVNQIKKSLEIAGSQIIKLGFIKDDILSTISQPLSG